MTVLDAENASAISLVIDFVNTHANDEGRREQISGPAKMRQWAREHDREASPETDDDAEVASAHRIRDALTVLLRNHTTTEGMSNSEVETAQRTLARAVRRYRIAPVITVDGMRFVAGNASLSAGVLAAVATVAASDEWASLKACINLECGDAFLDRSRNHAGRYCTTGCSSRVSMRAYRQRIRHSKT